MYAFMGFCTLCFINCIAIDSRNNEMVFVVAIGSFWGFGGECGIYKIIDGGKMWK